MPAPIGNKFAQGHGFGRPAKYESAEELTEKIIEFFVWCEGEFHTEQKAITIENKKEGTVTEKEIDVVVWDRPSEVPNWTNLALFLGFESRQSLSDYGKNEVFSYPIKRAKLVIENYYEDALLGDTPTGAIFALKNFGWQDKQTQEHTGKDGEPIEIRRKVNYDELSDEQLDQIIARGSKHE